MRVRGVPMWQMDRSFDDDNLPDKIKELLGWSEEDETHELRENQVDGHEDDEPHVQSER